MPTSTGTSNCQLLLGAPKKMALRLRRLLLPGRVRWRRGISSENYGRRAELYDEDVFVPIDEAPAGVARRRATASWSDVRTILEVPGFFLPMYFYSVSFCLLQQKVTGLCPDVSFLR